MLRNFNIPRSSALIPRNFAKLAPERPNLIFHNSIFTLPLPAQKIKIKKTKKANIKTVW